MRRFPDVRIKNLIDHPSRPAARPFSPGSNYSLASYSTTSSSGGKPRGKPRKPKKVLDNIASMGSQEIVELSQAICNLEFENYAKLTLQSAIQTLATWKDKQRVPLFLPFAENVSSLWFLTPQHFWVPLSNKLRGWVIEECLNKSVRYRQDAYKVFYMIAKVGNQV